MNLEDRIRDAGRRELRSYVPSGGLDQRITEHTARRARRRRRQMGAAMATGAVVLVGAGTILANRPGPRVIDAAAPAADPTPAMVPTTTVASPPTSPTTTAALRASTTVPVTEPAPQATPPPTTRPAVATKPSSAPAGPVTTVPVSDGDTVTLRYDSELQGAPAGVIVEFGIDVAMPGGPDAIVTMNRFDRNEVLVVAPWSGQVVQAELPGGERTDWSIPVDDLAGPPVDAAIGPDGVLYVARRSGEAATLVAYRYSGHDAPGQEVGRWPMSPECVETWCAEVDFTADGIDLGTGSPAPYAGAVSEASRPSATVTAQDDASADPAGASGSGCGTTGTTVLQRYALGAGNWAVRATCTQMAEGLIGSWSTQIDGSLLTVVEVASPTNPTMYRRAVIRFATGEPSLVREIPFTVRDLLWADGRLFAVDTSERDRGPLRLVELDLGH